jgi:class 3 adenylate cyclase
MDPFESITRPQKADLLICFTDIEGFTAISRAKADPLELFELLSGFARRPARWKAPPDASWSSSATRP